MKTQDLEYCNLCDLELPRRDLVQDHHGHRACYTCVILRLPDRTHTDWYQRVYGAKR
mgnify:CR=1 FL=1